MHIERLTQVNDEIVQAFARLMPQLTVFSPIPTRAELEEILHGGASTLLLARDETQNDLILGAATLVTFRTPTGLHAWIEDVVVDQAARGQGLGEALTRAALEEARQRGLHSVDLTSRPSREAANRLYQRMGFIQRETNLYRYQLD